MTETITVIAYLLLCGFCLFAGYMLCAWFVVSKIEQLQDENADLRAALRGHD